MVTVNSRALQAHRKHGKDLREKQLVLTLWILWLRVFLEEGFHGSAEYRAHLVGVMAKRAVAACG